MKINLFSDRFSSQCSPCLPPVSSSRALFSTIQPYSVNSSGKLFTVMHINARFLPAHFTKVKDIVSLHHPDILAINETWLREMDVSSNFSINGYRLLRANRSSASKGGGVALYVNAVFSATLAMPDFPPVPISSACELTDFLCAIIPFSHIRLAVLVVYRSPRSNFSMFSAQLESYLSYCSCNADMILCIGDFNINVGNVSDSLVRGLSHVVDHFSLRQLISSPTRVTADSATIIDLLYVSASVNVIESGICEDIDVSDHLSIYARLSIHCPRRPAHWVYSRNLHNISDTDLDVLLSSIDWEPLYSMTDVESKLSYFLESFTSAIDRLAPLTLRSRKHRSLPWLTISIRRLLRVKRRALRRYLRTRVVSDWQRYKTLRNRVSAVMRNEKRSYILSLHSCSPRVFWQRLAALGGHTFSNANIPPHLFDPCSINNSFIGSLAVSSCSPHLLRRFLSSTHFLNHIFELFFSQCFSS